MWWVSQSRWLYAQAKYDLAQSLCIAAVAILGDLGEPYEPDLLRGLNNLGTLCRRLGQHDVAAMILEVSAGRHQELGLREGLRAVLNNLATTLSFGGQLERAEGTWKRCLELSPQQGDEETARVLDNLASFALTHGKEIGPEVLDHAKRARALWVQLQGENSPDSAISGVVLGSVELRRGNAGEARKWVVPSIETLSQSLGPEHPAVCGALNLLGTIELVEGRLGEARDAFARSLQIGHATLGPTASEVIEAAAGLDAVESRTKV